MKKLITMMLALLMLAMPVFSSAEIAGVETSELKDLLKENYTAKYIMEGQEMTADVTIEPTELLFAMTGMPEEQATVFKELMAAIGFRYTAQATDSMAQSGMALLLGGNEAVTVKGAYADKNLYATSNLLGDKVIQITGPQLKEQMNEQGIKIEAVEVTVSSHAFERNLNDNGQNRNGQPETEAKRKRVRGINLGSGGIEELDMDELDEEDKVTADMMARQGNTVDYMA